MHKLALVLAGIGVVACKVRNPDAGGLLTNTEVVAPAEQDGEPHDWTLICQISQIKAGDDLAEQGTSVMHRTYQFAVKAMPTPGGEVAEARAATGSDSDGGGVEPKPVTITITEFDATGALMANRTEDGQAQWPTGGQQSLALSFASGVLTAEANAIAEQSANTLKYAGMLTLIGGGTAGDAADEVHAMPVSCEALTRNAASLGPLE